MLIPPAQFAALLDSADSADALLQALDAALRAELESPLPARGAAARIALGLLHRLLTLRLARISGLISDSTSAPVATFTSTPAVPETESEAFAALIDHLLSPCPSSPSLPSQSYADSCLLTPDSSPPHSAPLFAQLSAGRRAAGAWYTPPPIAAFMCREALKGYLGFDSAHLNRVPNPPPTVPNRLSRSSAGSSLPPASAGGFGPYNSLLSRLQPDFSSRLQPSQSPSPSITPPQCTSPAPAIERFVDARDASALADPPAILARLQALRVCDPACGSGALLVAMMQELLALSQALHETHGLGPADPRQCVLAILSQNLYGMDLDPLAVQLTRLRLCLLLPGEPTAPASALLSTLCRNITQGDSLLSAPAPHSPIAPSPHRPIAPSSSPSPHSAFRIPHSFHILLANPPYVRQERLAPLKPALHQHYPEVYDGRADLLCYFYARALELLAPGGMLSIISSNKWLRAHYGRPLRRHLAAHLHIHQIIDFGELPVFPNAATFPMILLASKSPSPSCSQSDLALASQSQSRSHSQSQSILSIKSIGAIPSIGSISPIIASSASDDGYLTLDIPHSPSCLLSPDSCLLSSSILFTPVRTLAPPYPDLKALVARDGRPLPAAAIQGADWNLSSPRDLTILSRMTRAGQTLKAYTGGRIFAGIKTGLNQAFWLTDAQARALLARDPACAQFLRPLLRGDAVRKWTLAPERIWLIYTPPGAGLAACPALLDHLAPFRERLERRALRQQWFELQQAQARYARDFPRPKIVYPDIAKESRFTLDASGAFIDMTAFALPTDDLFLLAVLNSQWAWQYLAARAAVLGDARRGGRLRLKRQYMETLPVPAASDAEQARLAALAEECLKTQSPAARAPFEREIDERLAALYRLENLPLRACT